MGDALRINGFRFYIPPRDHSPAHVHVKKGDFATRLDISGKGAMLMKGEAKKRRSADAKLRKQAIQLANENLALLKKAWEDSQE